MTNSKVWRFVWLILLFQLGNVDVHAHQGGLLLLRSDPPINGVLAAAPSAVRLWFEDPINPVFSSFQLRDINTRLILTPPSRVSADDPTEMVMLLDTALPDGLYTVTYLAYSAADGHESQGSFVFIVGQVTDQFAAYLDLNETADPGEVIARWLLLLGFNLLIGGLGVWIFTPWSNELPSAGIVLRRLIWGGWTLIGIVEIATLLLRVSQFGDLFTMTLQFIVGTRQGVLWCVTMIVWGFSGIFLLVRRKKGIALGLVSGLTLILLHSLASRYASYTDSFAAVSGHWLHTATSSLSLGGILSLIVIWRTAYSPEMHAGMRSLWVQFARFAVPAILAAAVTGAYFSWLATGSLEAWFHTRYGQALLGKIVLCGIGLIVCSGVYFIFRQPKRVRLALFAGIFGANAVTAGLLVTAFLVVIAPAREVIALRTAIPSVPDVETTAQSITTVGAFHTEVIVSPAVMGTNTLDFIVFDSSTGSRIADLSALSVMLRSPSGEVITPPNNTATAYGDGIYVLANVDFPSAGNWVIEAALSRPDYPDAMLPLSIEIMPPRSSEPPTIDTTIPAPERLIAAGLSGAALLVIAALWTNKRLTGIAAAFVALLTVLALGNIAALVIGVLCIGVGGSLAGQMRTLRDGQRWTMIALVLVAGMFWINAGMVSF